MESPTHYIIPMGGIISGTSGLLQLHGWGIEEMVIKKKVALHLWWPGHGLSIPQPSLKSKTKPKSIAKQDKERIKRITEINEYSLIKQLPIKSSNGPVIKALYRFLLGRQ